MFGQWGVRAPQRKFLSLPRFSFALPEERPVVYDTFCSMRLLPLFPGAILLLYLRATTSATFASDDSRVPHKLN